MALRRSILKNLTLLAGFALLAWWLFGSVSQDREDVRELAQAYCHAVGARNFEEAVTYYEPGAFGNVLGGPVTALSVTLEGGAERYSAVRFKRITVIWHHATVVLDPDGSGRDHGRWELTAKKIDGRWYIAREAMNMMSMNN